MLWRRVALETVDSTNEEVKRRAEQGEAEGLAITALRQTAGRGRRGRAWESPEGNLFVSLLLRPKRSPLEAATLSFLSCLAMAEAVEQVAPQLGPKLACKWPNDLLLNGGKLCGILLESRNTPAGGVDYLVIGIGVNLVYHPADTPYPATSLAAEGVTVTREDFLAALLDCIDVWYERWSREGFAPVREAWLKRALGLGQQIVVRLQDSELRGRFKALDDTGALLLETADGGTRIVTAGDVFPAA